LTFEPILTKLKGDQVLLHGAVSIDSVDCANTTLETRFLLRILKDAGSMRREAKNGKEVRSWPGLVIIRKTQEDLRTLRDSVEGYTYEKG